MRNKRIAATMFATIGLLGLTAYSDGDTTDTPAVSPSQEADLKLSTDDNNPGCDDRGLQCYSTEDLEIITGDAAKPGEASSARIEFTNKTGEDLDLKIFVTTHLEDDERGAVCSFRQHPLLICGRH